MPWTPPAARIAVRSSGSPQPVDGGPPQSASQPSKAASRPARCIRPSIRANSLKSRSSLARNRPFHPPPLAEPHGGLGLCIEGPHPPHPQRRALHARGRRTARRHRWTPPRLLSGSRSPARIRPALPRGGGPRTAGLQLRSGHRDPVGAERPGMPTHRISLLAGTCWWPARFPATTRTTGRSSRLMPGRSRSSRTTAARA